MVNYLSLFSVSPPYRPVFRVESAESDVISVPSITRIRVPVEDVVGNASSATFPLPAERRSRVHPPAPPSPPTTPRSGGSSPSTARWPLSPVSTCCRCRPMAALIVWVLLVILLPPSNPVFRSSVT
ncbi:hypothetical protein CPSG_09745 [Coccidioides posadasii str. Silveira]|uniref:Uncharacterized protein n=1 Tax=Coccidioides posadasii (strain RMSCC 757 / Silveira) TaxID=443226 RepID=E9DIV2_COCPS|nr:hypothetical protein CPSG_09745 [Coccidioides posadasii str. Silveira]